MRVVLVSDTHNRHAAIAVPDGDLLVHAGDATSRGTPQEVAAFNAWLLRLPHRHKVFIAGNHDFLFQQQPAQARALLAAVPGLKYLEDEETTVEGLRIWGTPWQPWFYDWAFNLPRGLNALYTDGGTPSSSDNTPATAAMCRVARATDCRYAGQREASSGNTCARRKLRSMAALLLLGSCT